MECKHRIRAFDEPPHYVTAWEVVKISNVGTEDTYRWTCKLCEKVIEVDA